MNEDIKGSTVTISGVFHEYVCSPGHNIQGKYFEERIEGFFNLPSQVGQSERTKFHTPTTHKVLKILKVVISYIFNIFKRIIFTQCL